MRYPVDWVDAFSDRPFGGNGCAVVHDAAALTSATCMAFVRETSLVECTFVEASEVADAKVRYFVASREIPFAGHPTVATVASLLDRGHITGDSATLETGAGLIPIDIARGDGAPLITMTQNAPSFGAKIPAEIVARAVGLSPEDIADTPQIVSTGLPFCITLLRSHEALKRAALDTARMTTFLEAVGVTRPNILEPYLVALGGATNAGGTFARLLLEPPLPPEDPFTGSATGAAAAYLYARGHIGATYVAEQGHGMGRPGQAQVEVLGPRDGITGVRVSGQGFVLMRGELDLGSG